MKRFSFRISQTRLLQAVQGFRFAANFILAIVLARLATKSQLQDYESFMLLVSTISFSVLSGVSTAFLPELSRNYSLDNWNAGIFATTMLGCILGVIGFVFSAFSGNSVAESSLIAAVLVSQPISNLLEYQLFFRELPKKTLIWSIFSSVATVALGGVFFHYWGAVGCLSAVVLVAWIRTAAVLSQIIFPIKVRWKPILSWYGSWLPMIGVALVAGIADYADSWLVRYLWAADFVGYRYGARELPIATLLANGISLTYSAKLAQRHNDNTFFINNLKEETRQFIWIMFGITATLMVFSKPLFLVVYGADFTQAADIFFWYLFLSIPRGLFPQILLIGYGSYQAQFWITAIETTAHLILSILFITTFGPVGAAISAIISYSLEKVLLWAYCRSKNWPVNEIAPVKTWLTTTILTIILGILVYLWR